MLKNFFFKVKIRRRKIAEIVLRVLKTVILCIPIREGHISCNSRSSKISNSRMGNVILIMIMV